MRLHIGGREAREGWKILNIQPGPEVDFVGDIQDLTRFADASCDEIYASHVLEHVPGAKLHRTLQGMCRILKPGGRAMLSVPDLEVLSRQFLREDLDTEARIQVMRMIFGGQLDPHDFHYVGLSYEILRRHLGAAGFKRIERVQRFGLFDDASMTQFLGTPISLNVVVYK